MNTIITPTWVTKDTATNFKNNTKLIGNFDRQWDENWTDKPEGAQIGSTAQVRIQQRFTVTEGQGFQAQALLNQTVPVTLNHQFQVGMNWSSKQATVDIEMVQERYTKPAGRAQASKWDAVAGAEVYKSVYNSIGTPGGGVLTNYQTWTDGVAHLQDIAVPQEYCAVVTPLQQSGLLQTSFAQFNPAAQVSTYFKTGQFAAQALGADEWYYDPLLPTHTTGSFTASTPIVTSGSQTGSTLTTSGWGTYALVAGDVFTVDGVYEVNPVSYTSTGRLQQFVLTAAVSGSSTATLTFSPAIITSGQLQTVTASPAANAAVNVLGATGSVAGTMTATASRQNLLFHRSAFAFVMVSLDDNLPGAVAKTINDRETQISMRFVEQYNGQTDQKISRIDTLGGVAAILPYFAIRAWN